MLAKIIKKNCQRQHALNGRTRKIIRLAKCVRHLDCVVTVVIVSLLFVEVVVFCFCSF